MFLKSKKSLLVLSFVAISMISILSGCGKTATKTEAKSEVLKVGLDDVTPPMEFKDDKGTTVGFDIDLANAIGKKLNRKVEIVPTAWDGIFLALKSNKFDCIISDVSITDERVKEFSFSKPYINNSQAIVVPKSSTISSPKDLKGKKVGVIPNSTGEEAANKFVKETPFEIKKYDQTIQFFSDLKIGRIDALVTDIVTAQYYVNTDKEHYKIAAGKLTNEPLGICFKKDNTKLRDEVQKAFDELKADGTLKKISEKWFGEDLVTNIN